MRSPDAPRKRQLLRNEAEIPSPSGRIRRSETMEQLLVRVEALEAENARLVADAAKAKSSEVRGRQFSWCCASLTNHQRYVLCEF